MRNHRQDTASVKIETSSRDRQCRRLQRMNPCIGSGDCTVPLRMRCGSLPVWSCVLVYGAAQCRRSIKSTARRCSLPLLPCIMEMPASALVLTDHEGDMKTDKALLVAHQAGPPRPPRAAAFSKYPPAGFRRLQCRHRPPTLPAPPLYQPHFPLCRRRPKLPL
jgi:hypothetical protein